MNRTLRSLALVSVCTLAVAGSVLAQARPAQPNHAAPPPAAARTPLTGVQHFEARPGGMSRVTFTSDAPLETFDGVSTGTTGTFTVNLGAPNQGLSGRISVDVASLRTGSDMRDEHLRSANWLNAAQFPQISFELTGTSITTALTPGAAVTGNASGHFTVHGVTHDVTVPVTLHLVPLGPEHAGMDRFGVNADMLRVQGEFHISLSDYGISINPLFRLKVSNDQRVRIDLTTFRTAG